MKKKLIAIVLVLSLAIGFGVSGCATSHEETKTATPYSYYQDGAYDYGEDAITPLDVAKVIAIAVIPGAGIAYALSK